MRIRAAALVVLLCTLHRVDAACDKGYSFTAGVQTPKLATNWMASLFDTTPLSQLSLPGTHDTMAYKGNALFNLISQCQVMTLADQLNTGIRLLDIRCKRVNNQFSIFHGSVDLLSTFSDVLTTVRTFLTANPSETIVMRIKEEGSATSSTMSFQDVFLTYYNANQALFYKTSGNTNPLLKDVRGKIVILQDWGSTNEYGINWSNALNIQDQYSMSSTCSLASKWSAIKNKLSDTTSGSPSTIYVNFLSASGGGANPYFYASGKSSSGTCDSALRCSCSGGSCISEFFKSGTKIFYKGTNMLLHDWSGWSIQPRRVGMVYADFPDGNLVQKIYAQNSIIVSNSAYEIRPAHISTLNKCFNLPSGNLGAGVKIEQSDCTGAAYQKFTMVRAIASGVEYVQIKTSAGLCLEVENSSTGNGARIQTATCTTGNNQRFIAEPRDGGFRLMNINSQKCIDVDSWSTGNGVAIHQWDCFEQANEYFKVR